MQHKTEGLRRLRRVFRVDPALVKAAEARELGWDRRLLDHLYHGRRLPTLAQTEALKGRYGIPLSAWLRGPRGGRV